MLWLYSIMCRFSHPTKQCNWGFFSHMKHVLLLSHLQNKILKHSEQLMAGPITDMQWPRYAGDAELGGNTCGALVSRCTMLQGCRLWRTAR